MHLKEVKTWKNKFYRKILRQNLTAKPYLKTLPPSLSDRQLTIKALLSTIYKKMVSHAKYVFLKNYTPLLISNKVVYLKVSKVGVVMEINIAGLKKLEKFNSWT